jgi:hypothetical protein
MDSGKKLPYPLTMVRYISRIILAFLPAVILLASCSCPEPPALQRYGEYSLGTPDGALEYFRLAVARKDAYHQYLCFSKEMRDVNPDLTVSNLHAYQERLEAMVREELGSVQELEIESATIRPDQPYLATVIVSDGNRKQAVTMVLETTYAINWTDGQATFGTIPVGANPVSILQQGRMRLDVSIRDRMLLVPETTTNSVHQIAYYRDWKILRTERGPLAEALKRKLEGAEKTPAP